MILAFVDPLGFFFSSSPMILSEYFPSYRTDTVRDFVEGENCARLRPLLDFYS